jgi:hypothetical protein
MYAGGYSYHRINNFRKACVVYINYSNYLFSSFSPVSKVIFMLVGKSQQDFFFLPLLLKVFEIKRNVRYNEGGHLYSFYSLA